MPVGKKQRQGLGNRVFHTSVTVIPQGEGVESVFSPLVSRTWQISTYLLSDGMRHSLGCKGFMRLHQAKRRGWACIPGSGNSMYKNEEHRNFEVGTEGRCLWGSSRKHGYKRSPLARFTAGPQPWDSGKV